MLVPAILYSSEITVEFQKNLYTQDMMYVSGCMDNWVPKILDCPDFNSYQYAIIDENKKLIGFLCYRIDWYASKAYDFGLMSFDRGNPLIGKAVFNKLNELVTKLHRVSWNALSNNPACHGYDNFVTKHGGNKHILKDVVKDKNGNYHDSIIYEIVSERS